MICFSPEMSFGQTDTPAGQQARQAGSLEEGKASIKDG